MFVYIIIIFESRKYNIYNKIMTQSGNNMVNEDI